MTCAALQVDELHTLDDLRRLRGEWRELWARVPGATPFQSPAWLLPWMETFAPGAPLVLTMRRAGSLVAVAPFYVAPDETGMRWLRLIGAGNTDYLDVLAPDEHARTVAAGVLAHLGRRGAAWDVADLWPLAGTAALLAAAVPDGLQASTSPNDVCPTLVLPATVEHLADHVPARFLSKLRYYRRRLERSGELRVRLATCETVCSLFSTLAALHEARWRERGESGVLHDPAVRAFHQAALPALCSDGTPRLLELTLDGRTVACVYVLLRGTRAWYYLGGFDPAYERFSVGTVAVGHAIDAAIRDGARTFDFLRGAEPYKYAWGAADRPVYRRTLRRAGALSGVDH
ncbi:MAG TPA: GNAT family N-acetyltransferase [Gemmatimonadaceae bacterium]|nr:GNAT family N-acetyltransferase [Gemmatimonadaceae bacterium]